MITRIVFRITVIGVQLVVGFCPAAWASEGADYYWQKQMLLEPSGQQMQQENLGQVFIYDGIKSADIELAMDTNYDRIENMMFINTVWTNSEGEPLTDPYTGEPLVDDDC